VARAHGLGPSAFPACGDSCPVDRVNWFEAAAFANKLSAQSSLPACYLDPADSLPYDAADAAAAKGPTWLLGSIVPGTPAERGGVGIRRAGWDHDRVLLGRDHADWQRAARPEPRQGRLVRGKQPRRSRCSTMPVGLKAANAWGLLDMHGNAWEWAWTCGTRPTTHRARHGSNRPNNGVVAGRRSGSAGAEAFSCRSAERYPYVPGYRSATLGFRLVRTMPRWCARCRPALSTRSDGRHPATPPTLASTTPVRHRALVRDPRPAGPFMMGCNEAIDTQCTAAEKPYHAVTVPAFLVGGTEVTGGRLQGLSVRHMHGATQRDAVQLHGRSTPFARPKPLPDMERDAAEERVGLLLELSRVIQRRRLEMAGLDGL